MDLTERRQQKEAERKSQEHAVEQAATLNLLLAEQPDFPLWNIVASMQTELAKPTYSKQHGDNVAAIVVNPPGEGMAVTWSNGDIVYLVVQATPRPVPRVQEVAPPGLTAELLDMIEDVNRNNVGVSAKLIRMAFEAFADLRITAVDADPDGNFYAIQGYTQDWSHLLDIQLDYAGLQDCLSKA